MLDIIKDAILPSGLVIIFFIIGSVLLLAKKIRPVAIFMLAIAGMLYVVFGNGPVSFSLLGNLENQYPQLSLTDGAKDVDTIVLLTGYAEINSDRPISSKVNSASAFRVIEALRVFKTVPEAEILISGRCVTPQIMKRLLVSLGAPVEKVAIEDKSANTHESAVNLQKRLGGKSFVLVTSAGHMPRAMGTFRKLGMNPIPAPTDYKSIKNYRAIAYVPSPLHLECSDLAVYEYLGIIWYKLKGHL